MGEYYNPSFRDGETKMMLYLQGLLKAHRHRAQFLKQNVYPGLGLYLTIKSSEILLFLINLQTHGYIVTGFFYKAKLLIYTKSFAVAENALSDLQNAQGCIVCKTCMY